jgi:NAD(P)-dependent dehydrogenase (short-subunit alcohol dehydrogenase family)
MKLKKNKKSLNVFSLEGKVIVVTGGTKRYGYYFSIALAEAGGTVILTSRDKRKAEEVAQKITRRGLKAFGYSLELADDNSINEFVNTVIKIHKKIDVLINNARYISQVPHYKITRKELDKSFTINSVGMILLTRCVVEEMKKDGGGNIINISSIYGMVGQVPSIYKDPDANISLDYPIQKGGIIAYTRQLATILAQYNIRVNCLTLGGLSDSGHDPYFLERYNKRVPLGRMVIPEDIKGPIVFLASDASTYMTGANLIVDGGWTAW